MSNKHKELSKERKKLQKENRVPDWYSTQSWQLFKSKYMVDTEGDVKSRFQVISRTLAKHLPVQYRDEYETKFFDLMWAGILSPASPVLANTGTNRGTSVSCSGQYIPDSIDGFYSTLRESALLSKNGFGTSGYFGDIRPRGSKITGGGIANGAKPVIEDFFQCASNVSHGGMRVGSFAGYIDMDSDVYDECVASLHLDHKGKNYGWNITDEFTQKLVNKDPIALAKWQESLNTKLLTGKGYLFFPDKANRHRPQMYKDLGLDIKASNLCCMTADQRVVTDKGILTVKELYDLGTPNFVVGLDGISKASPMLLPRPNAPIVQIETAEGYSHKVTPDHRVWKKDYGWIEAQHLVEGDKILTQQIEGLFGNQHNPELALLMGLIAGDGTYTTHSVCIDLWKDKTLQFSQEIEQAVTDLIQNESISTTSTLTPTFSIHEDKARLSSAPLSRVLEREGFNKETKLQVPDLVWKGTKETVEYYLRGLYVTDGHIQSSNEVCSLVLASVDKSFLQDIQILWANLGVKTSINKMRTGGLQDFGKGGIYQTQDCYRLLITSIQGCQIAEKALKLGKFRTGITADNYNERLTKQGYAQKLYATFTGLTELPNEDAYCLMVDSDTHAWTVNGLITHNTEIMLHSSEEYTYSCILSSLNLFHWDTIKDSDAVFTATVFLDCLCSEFIEQAEHKVGLEKVREFTLKGRAIGLGVMGLSTYFQSKSIPFESLDAMFTNDEIFKHIHDESLRASQWLANVLGEPEWCKGYGLRNTHRTAIAPTKSTAGLLGGMSESVFVDPAMAFTAGSVVGELARIPPVFLDLMKTKGVYNQETITDIINHVGSVQHVDWLDTHEKLIFKNAFECDPFVNFRYAKNRQKYLCQGQSLNFFLPNNENTEQVLSDLMTACVLDENILSQYYVYTRSGVVISDECVSCHG